MSFQLLSSPVSDQGNEQPCHHLDRNFFTDQLQNSKKSSLICSVVKTLPNHSSLDIFFYSCANFLDPKSISPTIYTYHPSSSTLPSSYLIFDCAHTYFSPHFSFLFLDYVKWRMKTCDLLNQYRNCLEYQEISPQISKFS